MLADKSVILHKVFPESIVFFFSQCNLCDYPDLLSLAPSPLLFPDPPSFLAFLQNILSSVYLRFLRFPFGSTHIRSECEYYQVISEHNLHNHFPRNCVFYPIFSPENMSARLIFLSSNIEFSDFLLLFSESPHMD